MTLPDALPAPGGVLALDVARRVGWCYIGPTRDCGLRSGVWELPSRSLGAGAQGCALENRLAEEVIRRQPKLVLYEAALPTQNQEHTNLAAISQAFGLAQMVEAACWRNEVRVDHRVPTTIRAEVMGQGAGRLSKKEKETGIIVRWLEAQYGVRARSHDEADAILLALYGAHNNGRPMYEGGRKWTR
jgi:Holliday junction resolvasome RuvABC endonuclease subunit